MKFSLGKASIPLVLGLGLLASGGAQAKALVQGQVQYEDEDWESQVLDVNGDGKLGQGDILLAILEIQSSLAVDGSANKNLDGSLTQDTSQRENYDQTTATVTAVSMITVDSVVVSGPAAQYTFTASSAADWLAYAGLVLDGTGTMVILYDDPPNPAGHVDPAASGFPNDGDLTSEVGTAADGTKIGEFGFAGDVGEFWSATSVAGLGGDPTDVTQITSLEFFAALNLTDNTLDPGVRKHNLLGDPDLLGPAASGFFTDASDLQIQGTKATGTTGNFQLKTDTDLYLVVPVPGTLALFGLGLASLGLGFRRKS